MEQFQRLQDHGDLLVLDRSENPGRPISHDFHVLRADASARDAPMWVRIKFRVDVERLGLAFSKRQAHFL